MGPHDAEELVVIEELAHGAVPEVEGAAPLVLQRVTRKGLVSKRKEWKRQGKWTVKFMSKRF